MAFFYIFMYTRFQFTKKIVRNTNHENIFNRNPFIFIT
jgi:hypothetical protein